MSIRTSVSAALMGLMLMSAPAMAQQPRHVASADTMRAAVATKAQSEQQTRDAVRRVLRHEQTAAVAARLGLNVVKAEAALATLSSADLARVADTARQADAQLAGGQSTIVISTTTALLILIIVILLVD
jgi:hypothetical protein